jgi:molybdopterin molybdotransferase
VRDVRMRGFRDRRTVADALAILEARTCALGAEEVPITEAAGRVVACDVTANVAVPHFARAAMDGYALAGESTFGATSYAPVELFVVGEVRAGGSPLRKIQPGEAVRITTGAPVPDGADSVLMAENAEEGPLSETHGEPPADAVGVVRVREPIAPGKHVGKVGEDVPAGAVVVTAGRRLRAQDVGVLASVGVVKLAVVRRPTVRVLVTGDELLPPGNLPSGSKIVDANSLMLAALAARDGAASAIIEYVADRREAVRDAMWIAEEDVILVSGGSSVGPEDHAPLVLADLGEVAVHGVAMRPSSPAGFGFLLKDGRSVPVFLLPGNPVSCLCAYEFFAGPTLRALGGRPRAWPHRQKRCTVGRKIVSELGRTDYTRVKVDGDVVTPIMTSGASILSSTTRADGVVIVDADHEGYGEGETVVVWLYDE